MTRQRTYRSTMIACYVGYITQAVVNTFATLLFLTFQKEYNISLEQVSFLITVNFGTQLLVDFLSVYFIDRIGYRICLIAAHLLAFVGLVSLCILPELLPSAYTGLLISFAISAFGSGLIEVLISPVVQACPTENKSSHMSLLHSFYCWGQVLVILLSSLFFLFFDLRNWKFMAIFWAILPLLNAGAFLRVPIATLSAKDEAQGVRKTFTIKIFYLLALMMLCAGASEQAIVQWASTYAEAGLAVNKTVGDLAGPCMFALLMGFSRLLTAKLARKYPLPRLMLISSILCVISYLMIALIPAPVLSLAGCALCGFSVGILWPGTYSIATECVPGASTSLFALLALAGDIGCSTGPLLVGILSNRAGYDLDRGILAATIYPLTIVLIMICFGREFRRSSQR